MLSSMSIFSHRQKYRLVPNIGNPFVFPPFIKESDISNSFLILFIEKKQWLVNCCARSFFSQIWSIGNLLRHLAKASRPEAPTPSAAVYKGFDIIGRNAIFTRLCDFSQWKSIYQIKVVMKMITWPLFPWRFVNKKPLRLDNHYRRK